MKKKLFILYSAVLILFNQFIFVLDVSAAQVVADQNVQMELEASRGDSFVDQDSLYPINANSSKWKELETEEEKFEKTQIEPVVIKKMDTDTLLEATLKSPMLYTIENSNSTNHEDGAITFLNKTNAGKELLARADVKETILKEYLSLDIPIKTLNDYTRVKNSSSEDLYNTIMELLSDKEFSENVDKDADIYYRIHFLEGVILSDEIYPALSAEEKRQLYNKSLILNEAKQKSEVFSYNAEDAFTDILIEDDELAKIPIFPRKKLNKNEVIIYTPRGSEVVAEIKPNNHINSPETVTLYQKSRTNIKVIAPGYSGSNCHSYTWPGRNDIWMNYGPGAFKTDGSYVKVNGGGRATANYQKVTNDRHSAIVMDYTKQNQRIRTKTGGSPIYDCDLSVDFSGNYDIYQRVC